MGLIIPNVCIQAYFYKIVLYVHGINRPRNKIISHVLLKHVILGIII